MRGYKGFNRDMTCRDMKYEQGGHYEIEENEIELCRKGFHFCKDLSGCFVFYDKFNSRFFEIEANGKIIESPDKCVTSSITIGREITSIELNRFIYGYGDGYGYGSGIPEFNGKKVYQIDGVATIIDYVRDNVAKGFILQSDFTLTPCWIAKDGNFFAHGDNLHDAMVAVEQKRLEKSPIEERIAKFREEFPDKEEPIPARRLWEWHHILTGSCQAGRNAFARDHNIDLDKDGFSVGAFIHLTCNAYGGDVIRKLAEAYGIPLPKNPC